MSASENQAAETSKDADDRKVDHPWNIIHIRLPPRKRLSDASLILSKQVPGNTSNTGSKEVPEPVTDDPGKNLITASVQGEANIHSPRARLCNEADSNIMGKSLSAESESDTSANKLLDGANVSSLSKNLRVAAEEQGSDASSYAAEDGLCEEANNNNPSMILPLPVQELPNEENVSSLSKNLRVAAEEQGSDASSHAAKDGLCEEANNNNPSMILALPVQELPNEENDSTLSKNLRVAAEEQGSDASSYAGLSEEANNNMPSMIIPVPVQELPEDHTDNSRSKNLTTTRKEGKDEQLKSPRKKLIHDTDRKVGDEEGNYPSWNSTVTAVKYEKVFEEANHPISCEKLSDEAKNNGPSNGPTDSANNRPVYKRRRTSSVQGTGTSQNPPGRKLSASVGQAVEESAIAANMDSVKVYRELGTNIKRTVYLDNLSHQATEAKTNPSRTLSTTAIKCEVSELDNHPIRTKKLSDVARNKVPSNRPTHPAKESTPRKKPRTSPVQATGTSQNKSTTKISTSDDQAAKQSKSAADLEALKQYQEFEEKVKRTVYLDNLSDQATEAVIKAALGQFCTIRKVSFVVNYTIPYNIPQSAFVEMETEKDAEVVVGMLHDFPFMMSGMPRPVRAIRATAEMFHDRRRRPGSKLEFRWVDRTDRDYETLKKLKLLSRKHEVENFALIEHELEEEKQLAAKQQENLNCNYKMMEAMDSVLLSGMSRYISGIYNIGWNDMF
ncbi:unnamed protein product [Alopecurus aequalis]